MADRLLDYASACVRLLRVALDGSRLDDGEATMHAPQAIALLGRMTYLCEAALAQAKNRTERVIAIDAFRSRHDADLSAECSKQIAAVRKIADQ